MTNFVFVMRRESSVLNISFRLMHRFEKLVADDPAKRRTISPYDYVTFRHVTDPFAVCSIPLSIPRQ
jgi:hypothetical protein